MPHARGVLWARFRVAVAVVAATAILSVLVYLLTGGTLLQQKVTLYLNVPDATGLDTTTAVRVNGIEVGRVGGVRFSGSTNPNGVIRLTLQVEREQLRNIPANSAAQISTDSAIGNKYVDITQGDSAARIRPGGEIQYMAQPELLKTLDVQQFAKQLRAMDATLTDIEQGKSSVGRLVVGDKMYRDLTRWVDGADRAFRSATNATSTVGKYLSTDEAYRKWHDPLVELDDRLRRLQAGQGPAGGFLRQDTLYSQYTGQVANFRRSIAALRQKSFMNSDDAYNSWNQAVRSLIQKVDQINSSPAFSNSMTYDNLAGFAHELRENVREFRTNPKKFLRIQLF